MLTSEKATGLSMWLAGRALLRALSPKKVGKSGMVAGVDLNAGMIEAAPRYSSNTDAPIEWHQCDVVDLPFADASFDIAFCQQGLQFFPDKPAALSEIRRVLVPGGTMIVTVWSLVSPLFAAIGDAAERYISTEAATSALSPFAFRDGEVIKALVTEAAFSMIEMEKIVIERRIGQPEESIPKEIFGSHMGPFVEKLDESTQKAMFDDVAEALQDYLEHDGIVWPEEAHLIRAQA